MTDETLFAAALESPDRTATLAACSDAVQRQRVERLLAAHDLASGFLREPAVGRDTQLHDPSDETDDAFGFLSPATRPDTLGRIGHYDVLEILGRGGFGIVFRAFDDVLQRVVAVKVLAPSMAATSPARKRFLREARASAAIRHENVVQVHAVDELPLPHLVMEFVPGESLQQRLDRAGPLDPREVLQIARQVAEGLAAAHATGVVHRDIKPANILVEPGTHRARITDFGLARAADDASLTRSGTVAGTPLYMAPEQAKGESLDHRADLFSLGSVMYALLTGHPPFRADSTLAVLKRVADDTPRPIREVIPEVPDWLCRIVEKLHAKNPADRFQTAREVADVLADCEQQLAAHNELRDFTRIPEGMPEPRRGARRRWVASLAIIVPFLAIMFWMDHGAILYLSNRGQLELVPQDGLVSVIVLKDDRGVFDDNDPAVETVTNWLDMKKPHSLNMNLPPGKYKLNAGTWPADKTVTQWEVATSAPFATYQLVSGRSVVVTVKHGQRVRVRPVMGNAPSRPADNAPQSPGVPKQAADVPEFIKGTWKRDAITVEPKLPPEKARTVGQLEFDAVANGKVMRGRSIRDDGTMSSLILHSHDTTTDRLNSWFFSPEGEATHSAAGAFNPATRSFLWMERLPDGKQSVNHMDFVDANTVKNHIYDIDENNKIIFEMRTTFVRVRTPVPLVVKNVLDPKRPDEMKILDRYVGEWRNEFKPTARVERVKATSILGGRFIEMFDTDEATNKSDYSLLWYDTPRKQYRSWHFGKEGNADECTGTWDEAATTMTWHSPDKRREGRCVFKGDEREFAHIVKEASGRVQSETNGVSRRVAATPKP